MVADPVIAKGWVYASTADDHVAGLHIADPILDGWQLFGGNPHHDGLVALPPPLEGPRSGITRPEQSLAA